MVGQARSIMGRAQRRPSSDPAADVDVADVAETVVFIHIPKAGGTSYVTLLTQLLPGRHWLPPVSTSFTSEEAHRAADPDQLRRCTLIGGHLDFDLCRQVPNPRPVTVVRDPIARLVSAYRYGMSAAGAEFAWAAYFRKYRITLHDCLREDDLWSAITSPAAPQLAGCLWSGTPCASEAEMVARAKRNLSACTHVGIQERLHDSARLLPLELGLAPPRGARHRRHRPPPLEWLNASAGPRAPIPDRLRHTLEDRLSAEYEVYRHACAVFAERFAAHGLTPAPADPPRPIGRR